MKKQKENSHEGITWSEMGKQNVQAEKVYCFGLIGSNLLIRSRHIIAANIATYHRLGPFLYSIFITDVVFWPLTAVFLVVAPEKKNGDCGKKVCQARYRKKRRDD